MTEDTPRSAFDALASGLPVLGFDLYYYTDLVVSGAVKSPDLYEVPRDEPITVLKAVTLAGGTTDRAAKKKVQIMRSDADGKRVTLYVNLRGIQRGKTEDPLLQKGDIVLVPETFF